CAAGHARTIRREPRRPWQCRHGELHDVSLWGFCRRRYAAWAIAGCLGDFRGPQSSGGRRYLPYGQHPAEVARLLRKLPLQLRLKRLLIYKMLLFAAASGLFELSEQTILQVGRMNVEPVDLVLLHVELNLEARLPEHLRLLLHFLAPVSVALTHMHENA